MTTCYGNKMFPSALLPPLYFTIVSGILIIIVSWHIYIICIILNVLYIYIILYVLYAYILYVLYYIYIYYNCASVISGSMSTIKNMRNLKTNSDWPSKLKQTDFKQLVLVMDSNLWCCTLLLIISHAIEANDLSWLARSTPTFCRVTRYLVLYLL